MVVDVSNLKILGILSEAIRYKSVCAIKSKKDKAERIVEPHIIYVSTSGNELLDFWQTDGYSSAGGLPCWKRLLLADITSVRILESKFIVRIKEGYNPSNKIRYPRILCCVDSEL